MPPPPHREPLPAASIMDQDSCTTIPRKKRRREFTGCWRCRERKVKCDESFPCSACKRLGLSCDRSNARLVWVDRQKSYRSEGRRLMRCESTWENHRLLESEVVDLLISRCDSINTGSGQCLMGIDHNPFSVFPVLNAGLNASVQLDRKSNADSNIIGYCYTATVEDRRLFHHYVDYVSSVMMPFRHPLNPWKIFYPSVSLHYHLPGEKALYHAIIAHSAFNLACLSLGSEKVKFMRSATRHYNISIRHLNDSLQSVKGDSGSTLAAIMTLMMAEVYSGQSKKWKHHLQGAWALVLDQNNPGSWEESSFTRFSVQSLLIVRIISGTTLAGDDDLRVPGLQHASQQSLESVMDSDTDNIHRDIAFISSISSTPEFGFTIGAQKTLLECISLITTASKKVRSGLLSHDPLEVDDTVSRVLVCLKDVRAQIQADDQLENHQNPSLAHDLARYQLNAFLYAIYIYLYRGLLHVPPRRVARYVKLVFANIAAFSSSAESKDLSNFSLWPAFIAAVETYEDDDLVLAREWLEQCTHFGLGSRLFVKRIVESVWERREDVYQGNHTIDKGLIVVDWRDIVKDLDADILLV